MRHLAEGLGEEIRAENGVAWAVEIVGNLGELLKGVVQRTRCPTSPRSMARAPGHWTSATSSPAPSPAWRRSESSGHYQFVQ